MIDMQTETHRIRECTYLVQAKNKFYKPQDTESTTTLKRHRFVVIGHFLQIIKQIAFAQQFSDDPEGFLSDADADDANDVLMP